MKHSKLLFCLSTLCLLLLVSGCSLLRNAKPRPDLTHKTNNAQHRAPVVNNPARFPAKEPTSVMAVPRRPHQPLPEEVIF